MRVKTVIKKVAKKLFGIGPEDVDDYRKRGVKIGANPALYDCILDYGHGYLIEIGDNVTMAHVTVLTHDASTKRKLGYSKIGRVKIGSDVFIGHGTIILPGVTIGNNVVIGAGSVVKSDIPDNTVAVGNPAAAVCSLDKYIEKNRKRMSSSPVYDIPWEEKTDADREKIMNDLSDGTIGYDI